MVRKESDLEWRKLSQKVPEIRNPERVLALSQSVRAELVEVDEWTGRRPQNLDTAGQPWHNSRVGKRRVALAPRWELPGFRPSASRIRQTVGSAGQS